MVLVTGCAACGPLGLLSLGLSIPAIVMARRDLAGIDAGRLSPDQRSTMTFGLWLAVGSTITSVLMGVAMIALMVLYGGLIGAGILAALLDQ